MPRRQAKQNLRRGGPPRPVERSYTPAHYAKCVDREGGGVIHGLGAGDTVLHLNFMRDHQGSAWFDLIRDEVAFSDMMHMGRPVPRGVCVQGVSPDGGRSLPCYRHPVDVQPPVYPLSATVQLVVQAASEQFGFPFNHALVQWYVSALPTAL